MGRDVGLREKRRSQAEEEERKSQAEEEPQAEEGEVSAEVSQEKSALASDSLSLFLSGLPRTTMYKIPQLGDASFA
jgi:hypothetical protein